MEQKKLKKGQMYYCLLGDRWYPYFGIVKVKYIDCANYPYNGDLVFVEQDIDGIIHRFEAEAKDLYPLNKEILTAVLHNERQTRRIIEHPKSYDHKDAKEKIEGWIATLPKTDQKALQSRYREVYPKRVKPDGSFLRSKFKMKDWTELMHLYFEYKYPKVDVPNF